LKDKDISVRYRVCMAMIPLHDKDIVPVMIDLMGELSPNQLWPVEEALLRLAGEKAPNVSLGADEAGRQKCKKAWSEWFTANEAKLDMAKLSAENVFLGYTMIVQHNNRIGAGGGNVGEIFELDKDKNVRWKITVPTGYPVDAQILPNGRVLVAEYQANKVTERDLKGEVKWEYFCGGNPFSAQRLPNGNTFIAMQARLVEVDRNKQEVWSYQRPNSDIVRARKLPNGEVCFVSNLGQGQFFRMDAQTKNITKQFQINPVTMLFGAMDILPNGNVLIAHYNQQRVHEYDKDGKLVNNAINIQWPNSVVRLPNGNNLVTSYNQRQVYEFNGNQQVWNFQTDGIVFVARRR
jgi:outer membrane protein assembly factor BamB